MQRSVVLVCVLLVLGVASVPSWGAEIQDHPAVTRYPGSIPTSRKDDGQGAYTLVVGVDPAAKTDETALQTLVVEGIVTRLAYENPREKSAYEIFTNYREGLAAGGFEILFACETSACGPSYASSRWGRVTGLRYTSPDQRYVAARSERNGKIVYVAALVAKLRHQVEVVEVAEMERGLVTAKALGDGLLLEGRAVLDGLYFDTDKATLTAQSTPALAVIARFLQDRPNLKVYIVGHTDSTGGFDHNMQLSKNRAAAVVDALARDHGVDRRRLAAHGVGPLSPSRSNKGDEGRAGNRRVEMVEQ